jgi:CheY-like chemotaxis protein
MSASTPVESIRPRSPLAGRFPASGGPQHAELEIGAITQALDRNALELLVRRPRRRILLVEDAAYSGRLLARILGRWNFEVVTANGAAAACQTLADASRVDLAIVALPGSGPEADAVLAALRAQPALGCAPVLAVTRPDGGLLDFDRLRKHGVAGVIGRDMTAEHVAFRVGQILPLGSLEERRHVRVPADGELTLQRAENLSVGGLRLRSAVPLDVNAMVRLRFRLPVHPAEVISVDARVVHCQPAADREGSYVVGLFFRSISPRGRTLVEVEIVRMLTGPPRAEEPDARPA